MELGEEGLDGEALLRRFQAAYVSQYGESGLTGQTPVELSTVRVTGIGKTTRAVLPGDLEPVATGTAPKASRSRKVRVARDHAEDVAVYEAQSLRMGHAINGPALVDTGDTTLWAPPRSQVTMTKGGSFLTKLKVS
jgi:N-methylhydantoinase A